MQGSWLVIYQDGNTLGQFDATHPEAINGEVPLRLINWPQVSTLKLESQFAETTILVPLQTNAEYRLLQRTLMTLGGEMRVFLLLTLRPGYAYPFEQSDILRVLYWVPDGSTHDCGDFNCQDVRKYVTQFLWGQSGNTLAQSHETITSHSDAILV